MTPCEDCARAEANPLSPRFTSRCQECSARSLAQSPAYFDAMQAGTLTPTYKSALRYVFGEDWHEGHEKVKRYSALIDAARMS